MKLPLLFAFALSLPALAHGDPGCARTLASGLGWAMTVEQFLAEGERHFRAHPDATRLEIVVAKGEELPGRDDPRYVALGKTPLFGQITQLTLPTPVVMQAVAKGLRERHTLTRIRELRLGEGYPSDGKPYEPPLTMFHWESPEGTPAGYGLAASLVYFPELEVLEGAPPVEPVLDAIAEGATPKLRRLGFGKPVHWYGSVRQYQRKDGSWGYRHVGLPDNPFEPEPVTRFGASPHLANLVDVDFGTKGFYDDSWAAFRASPVGRRLVRLVARGRNLRAW